MQRKFSRLELGLLVILTLLLIVVFPALNAVRDANSALLQAAQGTDNFSWRVWSLTHLCPSDFSLNVWGKYLCYAMLAISVDLLWGYTGLLSLGQSLFFSLGGYMLGMHLMLLIGEMGKYAQSGQNPNMLPDFMVFLGYKALPTLWKPFYSFIFTALMVLVIPGLLAQAFGYLAFRSRIKGVYFSILTQALTYAMALMFLSNDIMLMGGNNGFTDFKSMLGHDLRSPGTQRGLFIATAILIVTVYVGCRWLTLTKFGLVQRAVRDSEVRVLFSGYAAANYKLFVFVLAGLIASVGGALYVPQVGIINPGEMQTDKSLEAVVWCAVGGRGTLIGPVLGAVSVNALKSWATRELPNWWPIILGGMFILVVLFLPKGMVSVPGLISQAIQRRRKLVQEAAAEPPRIASVASAPVAPLSLEP